MECRHYNPTEGTKIAKSSGKSSHKQRYDSPSEPLMQELGWLTIEQLIEQEKVKVTYKALHIEAPNYMKALFHKLSHNRHMELRS